MNTSRLILITCALLIVCGCANGQPRKYESVGLGGGGAMYEPASSPHDPKLMFVSCDMSGFYRSEDGGKTWQMIDFRQTKGNTRCRPAFHPTKPNVIWFGTKMSEDAGKTWKEIPNFPVKGGVTCIALSDGKTVIVGTQDGAWISNDEGRSWTRCEGVMGRVVGAFARWSEPGTDFIATDRGIFSSQDDGKKWVEKSEELPASRGIRSFAVDWRARREPGPRAFVTVDLEFYCTVPSKNKDGKFTGGIYRSVDFGDHWTSAMGKGLNTHLGKVDEWGSGDIAQYTRIEASGNRVYVVCKGTGYWPPYQDTLYRSDDAGATWTPIVFYDFRFSKDRTPDYAGRIPMNFEHGWIPYSIGWMWSSIPGTSGLHVNAKNPDVVMGASGGELHVTTDGGKLWKQVYTGYDAKLPPPVKTPGERPGAWHSVGLEVTTCWNYQVDPFDKNRHYICYTDIGFCRSEDGGRNWTFSNDGTPWNNTTYDIALDPKRAGRIWAAMSNVHDIPHWTYIHEEVSGSGGVCVSDDAGKTWKKSNEGLPVAPVVSIVMDPTSPEGNRTLYVALYNEGVYKSTDDGKSWKAMNEGVDLKTNNHTWLLKRHPDGTLFCGVTAKRGPGRGGNTYTRPGALYRSTDGGAHWQNILGVTLYYPTCFAVDPRDSKVIYQAAHTASGHEEGGVYVTTDGGKTWTRHLNNADFRGKGGPNWATPMMLTLDPDNPDVVYMGTDGHGLWISRDRAKTWTQFKGIPFGSVHRVTFDPDDHDTVYITTFGGGVWRGPRP